MTSDTTTTTTTALPAGAQPRPAARRTGRLGRRGTALLAGALLLPGVLAACTTDGADDTATSGPPAAGANAAKIGSCLRDKGYDVDDSQFSGSTVEVAPPAGVDPQAYIKDLTACSPDGGAAPDSSERQALQAENAKKDTEFAACIRDKGFDDYPDGQQERQDYAPSDPDAFSEVEETCVADVYGTSSEFQETGR
jgi:hypothetical protein